MLKRCALILYAPGKWRVDLPTFEIVAGSFAPITDGLIHADGLDVPPAGVKQADHDDRIAALGPTVLCELPDAIANAAGDDIDIDKLRAHYAGVAPWGREDYTPNI